MRTIQARLRVDDLTGYTIGGQFEIQETISRGTMAMVYKAYQISMDRTVAVKMLLGEYTRQPDFLRRFEREAMVAARLSHINILPIYHYDHFQNYPYLVVPFIDTGTLETLMQPGPMSKEDIIRLGTQVSNALDHAHSRGVVHRDVKPSNVLIDGDGNALLCDFGLARLVSADSTGSLTGADTLVGTPYYMSPEQCGGLPADSRSDVYSFTVMLYEMVSGDIPFRGATPLSTVLMHIDAEVPDLPKMPHLSPIFKKGLAKDPSHRYQTAGELMDVLRRALGTGEPDSHALYAPIEQQGDAARQTAPLLEDDVVQMPVQVSMSQVPALLDKLYTPALAEANHLDHGFLGVEHLFIALARDHKGPLTGLLSSQKHDPRDVIQAVIQYIGRGDGHLFKGGSRPTPRLMRVLQVAANAARSQGRFTPLSQELVIAILQEGENIPVRVLATLGVNLVEMFEQVLDDYTGVMAAIRTAVDVYISDEENPPALDAGVTAPTRSD
jgi:serine/threonine protein kinase